MKCVPIKIIAPDPFEDCITISVSGCRYLLEEDFLELRVIVCMIFDEACDSVCVVSVYQMEKLQTRWERLEW